MIRLFLLSILILGSYTGTFQSSINLLLPDESDPYLQAEFNASADLEKLLSNDANKDFLNGFEEKFAEYFDKEVQYKALKTKNVDDWELNLFEQRNEQINFLKENGTEINEEFKILISNEIRYNYWHMLLAYSINRSNEDTKMGHVVSLPRIMTDALLKLKLNDDKLLSSKSFREFLPYYVIYFNSQEKNFQKYSDGVLSMKDKGDWASAHLNGQNLDYALTKVIELGHKTLSSTSFSFWTSQIYSPGLQKYLIDNFYDTTLKNDEAFAKAKEESAKKKPNEGKTKGSLPNLMDLDDKAFTFDKFKGKVIYVDFWASWCGPCRAEFPHSRKMHEGLSEKQKKDIVFLYISIDQDLEAWKKAVEKLGLKEFGENAHSFEVSGKYQISSIPRYMIIDKSGTIVDDKAPRPSNPETLSRLLELAK